jgi:hypothetical protein
MGAGRGLPRHPHSPPLSLSTFQEIDQNLAAKLRRYGAHVAAPCPHDGPCPLAGSRAWCHFGQRFHRPAWMQVGLAPVGRGASPEHGLRLSGLASAPGLKQPTPGCAAAVVSSAHHHGCSAAPTTTALPPHACPPQEVKARPGHRTSHRDHQDERFSYIVIR